MEEINARFKSLRKACNKNQVAFGKVLGISSSGVADIESGRRNVTEKHLIMLSNWTEYNVNINWLRTGEGDMFIARSRNQIITDFLGDLIKEEDESFKKRLIEALALMDIEDWKALEKIATNIAKKKG